MRFVDLFENGKPTGRYDVPEFITGSARDMYRLNNVILSGGNGIVVSAKRALNGKSYGDLLAVKILRQLNPARIDRFNNEIRVINELSSTNIARPIDSGNLEVVHQSTNEKKSVPWLAMELGWKNMRQYVESNGPMRIDELKKVALDICRAVSHLHEKGFIHRDIKPDNFVWSNEQKTSLQMIDFGIAKRIGEDVSGRPMDTFTKITEFVGPVFFSSPELIEYASNKQHPVDFRSDIFQIGKLLWFLGTGKISAGIPSKKDCPCSGRLRDVVVSMIDDDPGSRPQSLVEVANEVHAI